MSLTNSTLLAPFLLVAALQFKHVLCDGPLQTLAMVRDKSHYLRPLGLAHAAIHAAASFLILLLFGIDLGTALVAIAVEFYVHYHIDYVKENAIRFFGWKTSDGPFWWSLSLDQALHHFTYLVMGFVLIRL